MLVSLSRDFTKDMQIRLEQQLQRVSQREAAHYEWQAGQDGKRVQNPCPERRVWGRGVHKLVSVNTEALSW